VASERFVGMVCVVNGAASEIGRAVAARLESEGGFVVAVDRTQHNVGNEGIQADLVNETHVKDMYASVVERHGRLDVIYNNMGLMGAGDGSGLHIELGNWNRICEDNLTSIFLSCKHGIPHLLSTEPKGGAVVNAASFLADIGAASAQMAYSASKAGVVQLSRDLGVALARDGVRVNSVLFGPIATAAQQEMLNAAPDTLAARMVHWPMGRFGTLDEAAAAVAFLASDDAGFITAAALPLDGGITQAFTVAGHS
jgi:NAD(P)-dependent dehydrogenase (short-subunit alcohol dehydrogenase family)